MIDPQRLQHFALFAELDEASLEQGARFCERRHYARNEALCHQGDPARAFFLVEYGRVKVFRAARDGREQVLHLVEEWQSFAEVAVLSMETYPASAVALDETAVIVVPREPFLTMVEQHPAATRAMLAGQARWLRRLIDQQSSLALEEVSTRLARYLVTHCERKQVRLEAGALIELEVKKAVVAAQIGTVPETLARNIKKLSELKLIARRGRDLEVLDAEGLRAHAFPAGLPES
jgi:CRP/FNR family transcriptional regulator